jgi:hypothetical protein
MREIVSESDRLVATKDGGTIYSPADMYDYVRLELDERQMIQEAVRRTSGVETRPRTER